MYVVFIKVVKQANTGNHSTVVETQRATKGDHIVDCLPFINENIAESLMYIIKY